MAKVTRTIRGWGRREKLSDVLEDAQTTLMYMHNELWQEESQAADYYGEAEICEYEITLTVTRIEKAKRK